MRRVDLRETFVILSRSSNTGAKRRGTNKARKKKRSHLEEVSRSSATSLTLKIEERFSEILKKDQFSKMRIFITLSLVVLVMGHPAHERNFPSNVYHKRSVQADGKEINILSKKNANEQVIYGGQAKKPAHEIEKRDAEDAVHSIEKRQAQNTNGTAENGSNEQVAISNEGAVARQGVNGQYVYASDYGGPIVQIEQHVYKSSCCYAGSTCPCSENGTASTPGP